MSGDLIEFLGFMEFKFGGFYALLHYLDLH